MIFIKKFFKILFFLLILVGVGLYFFVKTLYPTYKGDLELTDLSKKVTVIYDDNGVPHITAENETDAYIALGYVHAQDRLWQMELIRRITAGRLSEIFGEDLVKVDKFMGSLGVEEEAFKTVANLDKNTKSYKLTQAYLKGVNQFIENGATPIEFHLLGIKKEKYTINDVYNVLGYVAFSFANAFKTDPLINEIQEKLGTNYVKELGIPIENLTLIKGNNKKIKSEFTKEINKIVDKIPMPLLEGSNSWVLGSERTQNGKVIFENDPHIDYSQPSIWYQSHIKTPDYEMYGFNMALLPFPLLGHNRDYAYGITMFENDDIDFYIEENNPKNPLEYKTENGYERYKTYDKTIKVKGKKDVSYQLKVSRHGVVVNDIIEHINDKRPITMQWIYTHLPNKALEVSYQLSHSKSFEDFKSKLDLLHAPGLNIMYGDAKNNIAMYGVAKLYKYRDGVNRKTYLNGATGKDEITEYISFDKNIQNENPKSNYVYSANNQHDTIAGVLYPGYYLAEDRAKRITEIIEPKFNFSQKDVQKMAVDVTSAVASSIVRNASEVLEIGSLSNKEKNALKILQSWDGSYKKEEVAPTIYTRFIYEFLKNTFADEMEDGFEQFLQIPLEHQMRAVQMAKTESVWWDDISTKDKKETKSEIVTKSFRNAVAFLEKQLGEEMEDWTWSKVFSVEYSHAMGAGGEILRRIFNVGPFETNGGRGLINNVSFRLNETGYYHSKSGPSTRRVIDFSDVENSVAILPTGQSGNRFSPFYKDQTEKYLNGEYVKMLINPKAYRNSENVLILLPLLNEE